MALRETLKWQIHLQLDDVTLEIDSKMVVDAFHSIRIDNSEFDPQIKECKDLIPRDKNHALSFVKRQINNVTHSIAKSYLFTH